MRQDMPVGIIGLGLMGTALAERLVGAEMAVIGFDIDATRCDAFRDAGRRIAASASDLTGQSHAIVIAVYDGAQAEALFDALVKKTLCTNDVRGCALANAAVEIAEPDHPARRVVEKYKAEMRRRFRELALAMGAREPDALADSLMLLWDGSCLTCLTFPGKHGPVRGAANAARALIAAHINQ